MMYPWNSKSGSRRQQQEQKQQQSQRSSRPPGAAPIRSSSGYTTMEQSPARSANNDASHASSGDEYPMSINSQNPNDSMMDSVFNFVFADDDVTSTPQGGYLGDCGGAGESIEIFNHRWSTYYQNDTMPDSNEQGFEMQNRKNSTTSCIKKSRTTGQNNNNNFPSSCRSAAMSSAGSTAFTSTVRDDDYHDDYYNDNDDDDDLSNSGSNIVRIKPKHRTPGFLATLYAEFCHPLGPDWYAVRDTVTGRRLDFVASFAPKPTALVLSWKLFSTFLVLGTMAFSLWDFYLQNDNAIQDLYLWLSYFTHWSMLLATVYQLLSLSNTLCTTRGMAFAPPAEHVTGRVKWTWIFFTMALHSQVLAALFFWIAWFQPSQYQNVFWTTTSSSATTNSTSAATDGSNSISISSFMDPASLGFYYLTLVPHSLTCIAVAVDGLVVNRIPLRLMHWWGWILGYNLLYIAWTMIRSLVLYQHEFFSDDTTSIPLTEYGYLYNKYHDVMNSNSTSSILSSPNEDENATAPYFNLDNYTQGVDRINTVDSYGSGEASGNDAVYGNVLNWRDDWPLAAIQSVILCFAISPAIYILLWIVSLYQWPFCCGANDRRRYVKNHLDISIQEVGPFSSSTHYYAQQQQQDHAGNERQQKSKSFFGVSFW